MFNIKDLMQQAQSLQAKAAEIQQELAGRTVTGRAGGDMVIAVANGAQEIVSITVEKEIISQEESELLEDLIVAAVNDALRKSREMAAAEMSKLTGGMRIPGLS